MSRLVKTNTSNSGFLWFLVGPKRSSFGFPVLWTSEPPGCRSLSPLPCTQIFHDYCHQLQQIHAALDAILASAWRVSGSFKTKSIQTHPNLSQPITTPTHLGPNPSQPIQQALIQAIPEVTPRPGWSAPDSQVFGMSSRIITSMDASLCLRHCPFLRKRFKWFVFFPRGHGYCRFVSDHGRLLSTTIRVHAESKQIWSRYVPLP